MDQDWVPRAPNSSLYIRPTMIGTEIIIIISIIIRVIITIIMTGTEATLGLGPANQATLFVILSPVGSYFGGHSRSVTLLCDALLAKLPKMHEQFLLCLLQNNDGARAALQIKIHMVLEHLLRPIPSPIVAKDAEGSFFRPWRVPHPITTG